MIVVSHCLPTVYGTDKPVQDYVECSLEEGIKDTEEIANGTLNILWVIRKDDFAAGYLQDDVHSKELVGSIVIIEYDGTQEDMGRKMDKYMDEVEAIDGYNVPRDPK
ncbi:hypothetical protein SEA_GUEY18_20 [Gordonia phage Guey18]|nr:hypothetical protein SEA_GUEY18_20 [Gordonia phage Guey18]